MDPSYNNLGGFGSGGVQAPVGSGAGDIILTPEKKSHKGIIIALAFAVLIVGGLFAVMFLTSRGGGNANINNDIKLAFNKYANYLLYGEDSDRALEGEYDEDNIYRLDEMWSEDEKTVTNYFKTANEFLTNFELLINGNANSDFVTAVDNYRMDFELVRLTFNREYISEEELADEVLNNNLEDTKIWIANKYTNLMKSSYESIKQYAEAEIKYYQLYAEYLEELKMKGCFNDGNICDDSMNEDLESQMTMYGIKASNYEVDARRNLLEGCWNIEGLMGERGGV